MLANDIRKGMVILFDGVPCKVMDFHHHTPGNLRAMVQTRLRNLITGNSFEHRFRSNDPIEKVVLEQRKVQYLYSDGTLHYFMDSETYEQIAMNEEDLGEAAQWLMPNLELEIEFYNNMPIGIKLPPSIELTVVSTEPVLKGATVSNSNKPAVLENGVTIQVPPFITEGERIRVNPNEGRYIERVK
ncbi:MAG: elongation factor P [Acidobacteria bacterium]|nr:MAG: elongation factor P [Acidobacteriota bacterium]